MDKSDGSVRVILDLKNLNNFIEDVHFKMEGIKDVLDIFTKGCYMAKIDFKNAYFSVKIKKKLRKYFRFKFKGKKYQFRTMAQGLKCAPRVFTKLMKPVIAHFRKLGILVIIYIDDCLFICSSKKLLKKHIAYVMKVLDRLGLTINLGKSILEPEQIMEFLGFVLDSNKMEITLTEKRKRKIRSLGQSILRNRVLSIRKVSEFIGCLVAAEPAILFGTVKVKYLEVLRNNWLKEKLGNFDEMMEIDDRAYELVKWWVDNIDDQSKSLVK